MSQPCVNIGMVGHVDHGKTTLVRSLSGVWTDKHSEELKRGISIRLGYADTTFMKCPTCPEPRCYSVKKECPHCGAKTEPVRTVSFVDSPGHETLMATMLSGAAIMDGAILVIAANEECPQPQTKEHLMALDIIGIKNVVIVQNKIDLVNRKDVIENYKQIKDFVKGTVAENAPIIPISAQQDINIDALIDAMEKVIPTPTYKLDREARMLIARSFDINRPGLPIDQISGGVIGGTLTEGTLKTGDDLEIKPGRKVESEGAIHWDPIHTRVTGIIAGTTSVDEATPGGLLAVGTELDPDLTKSDTLTGQVAGKPGTLPSTHHSFTLRLKLLERVVGVDDEGKIGQIKTSEPLMLNAGTATTVGIVTSAREDVAEVNLKRPVCADIGSMVAISRRIGSRWRLIGIGVIED
ncbi:translation initiation factor 2 subunit gamma (aeIF-2g) [Methanohalophilus euhalobius]|uniref:Translation initiation factor 2 subunit gamma n=1 Tax=Methanohalophilus euhalobius TaxID=51203 RepID=A0A285GGH9_9EURY|nr:MULTISPECIES: translation initiation factor IF-2 subunit gamma [Methanohalophilus]ODV48907.1 MAG: translation initiation factor 2 subunit 3 [Methanohalophilus sp. 2-GBenrich]TCL11541.1 translation initiation factor 2 subunit gamma (aeIF-2g) [Methanohalophilus euhalobius]SNY22555.1 translation initiation factor 2 subunit gamma (aeIF-2g) [Methanohalophilus euhalobius]